MIQASLSTGPVGHHKAFSGRGKLFCLRNQVGMIGSEVVIDPTGRASSFSRQDWPEALVDRPSKRKGRREGRCDDRTRSLACSKQKAHERSHSRYAERSGLPCAMVLTAYSALSSVTGLFCHRPPGLMTRGLIPASGDQDHTPWPSACALLVSRGASVHRIPRQHL
jgi:hypothetical protein